MQSARDTLESGCLHEGSYRLTLNALNDYPAQAFVPRNYEPSYPYPLLVFFHSNGSNEEEALRLAPLLSRRNYVCLSLRGSQPAGEREDGSPLFNWEGDRAPEAWLDDYLHSAIRQLRRHIHIHTERVYLVGTREGATPAASLALRFPQHFAGFVSLNGFLRRESLPPMRLSEIRHLRVLLAHGSKNKAMPINRLYDELRLLLTGGVSVQLSSYPTNERLQSQMLIDLNRWLMKGIDTSIAVA